MFSRLHRILALIAVAAVAQAFTAAPASANTQHLRISLLECAKHYWSFANPVPFTSDDDVCTVSRSSIFSGADSSSWIKGRQIEIVEVLRETRRHLPNYRDFRHLRIELQFCEETYSDNGLRHGMRDTCESNISRNGIVNPKQLLRYVARELLHHG